MNKTTHLPQEVIRTLHPGLFKAPAEMVAVLMPELSGVMEAFPHDAKDFTADVKVHMLMPNQWPCIPNWHYDLVPRDENNNLLLNKRDPNINFWMWISGPPFTEFTDESGIIEPVEPMIWTRFNQFDKHRGTMSDKHQWRVFIRLAPKYHYAPNKTIDTILRRHSQVYLNAEEFTW